MSMPLSRFTPQVRNANKHKQAGLKALDDSIRHDGFIGAITTAADGETFAGSARLERSADIFGTEIEPLVVHSNGDRPIIVVRDDIATANDPIAKRLAIADNVVPRLDYDPDAELLAQLAADDAAIANLLAQDKELAALLRQEAKQETVDAGELVDKAAQLQEKWQVQRGQIFKVGDHRIMCGDSTSPTDVALLMANDKARLVWTDPPYGVKYGDKMESANAIAHRVRQIENDNLPPEELETFIRAALTNAATHTIAGAAIYVASPAGTPLPTLIKAFVGSGFEYRWGLIWLKDQMVLSRGDYHFKHENLLYGWKPDGAHYFTTDRTQTSVFEFPRPKVSVEHPTMKPPELIAAMLGNSSETGDIVYDAFCGSGSTLIACEQTSRKGRGMELAEKFVSVQLERLSLLGLTPERLT